MKKSKCLGLFQFYSSFFEIFFLQSALKTIELAEEFKTEGNQLYKNAKYRESINLYSKAIELCPNNASYYGNRAAAYLMINKYKECIEDSKSATAIDSKFVKVCVFLLSCFRG